MSIDVVYFDFSKAFDSVNHDLILFKLKEIYGINGRLLKFILNYLRGREQCVVLGSSKSDMMPVLSGVPQGSILRFKMFKFIIYIATSRKPIDKLTRRCETGAVNDQGRWVERYIAAGGQPNVCMAAVDFYLYEFVKLT